MKFLVVVLALVAVACAQRRPTVSIVNPYNSQYRYNPFSTPAPFRPVTPTFAPFVPAPTLPAPVVVKAVNYDSRNANIVKYANEINPDGSYSYYYETDNGIAGQAQGTPRAFGGNPPVVPDVAQGSFSWTSPEGIPIAISYTADENGYQPIGNAIPTPPPVPAQIARALEYIARAAPRK